MSQDEGTERRWLRPLGLLGVLIALSVNQPLVLLGVPFALLCFLVPGERLIGLLVAAVVVLLIFSGDATGGLWHLERGWAILVGGSFVAATLAWPAFPFLTRALASLAAGTAWSALILAFFGGWAEVERQVTSRIEAGAAASLEFFGSLTGTEGAPGALVDAVEQTARLQGILFPSLLGLSTLAALGVAWWLYMRLTTGTDRALAPLPAFRFPDALIWVMIGGLALLLVSGWAEGWGRLGMNLAVFMGGLYALRGAAVVLFVTGGLGLVGGIAVGLAALLAPPLLLASAMAVGIGDTWFDLRARWRSRNGSDRD